MTAALKTSTNQAGAVRTALAARLDLLLRHEITVEDFEGDVSSACRRDPDEIWVVLALLDQYHRLGRLPTALFRTLKSSADRRGLGRRGLPTAADSQPPASAPAAVATARAGSGSTGAAASLKPLLPMESQAAAAPPPNAAHSAVAAVGVGSLLAGRYLLVAKIHEDIRGTLFQAIDKALDKGNKDISAAGNLPDQRFVAVLLPQDGTSEAATGLAELQHGFWIAQQLDHPNIVRVHDLVQDGACGFMTMDFVPGETLASLMLRRQRKALPRATALAIIRDLGAALVHAHDRGIVHGDLRPDNVLISATGEVRLRGFGATQAHSPYASCEQLENCVPERRDDLYALACIACELLSGSHPFGLLNAAAARGRGLAPARPLMLTRSQWQALRIGLAWRRESRTVAVSWWLAQMRLDRAAPRLPALDTLASLPPPRRSWLRPVLLLTLAVTTGAAAELGQWPDRTMLTAGWNWFCAAALETPAVLHRLGDALSAELSGAQAAITPVADTARLESPVARSSAVIRKLRPAAAAPTSAPARNPVTSNPATRVALPVSPAPPAAAPAWIELSSDNYTVLPGEAAARIVVRRRGRLQGGIRFSWWTEDASAAAGRDYVDWGRRTERIPSGHDSVTLLVPIVSDAASGSSRIFYVAIGRPGAGVELGDTSRAAVLMPGGG